MTILTRPTRSSRPRARAIKRLDVQGLRAIAVLLVVAFHAKIPVHAGFAGVDVFFVISGFVITGQIQRLHQDARFSFAEFYSRRIKRLLPAMICMVLTVLVLSFLFQSPLGPQRTSAATAGAAMLLIANLEILHSSGGYFDAAATTNPLLHIWSLSVEEQFYLLFPLLLVIAWKTGKRSGNAARNAIWLVSACVALSFSTSIILTFGHGRLLGSASADVAFYSSPTRGWEFGVGVLLALNSRAMQRTRLSPLTVTGLAACGIVNLSLMNFIITSHTPYPGIASLLPVLGAAMLIAAGGYREENPISRLLSLPALVWIGERSYSIYLWHWPLIVFASMLWPGRATAAIAAVASFIPAYLSYTFIEKPLRGIRTHRLRPVYLAVLGCIVAVAILAAGLDIGAPHLIPSAETYRQQQQTLTSGRSSGCMLNETAYKPTDMSRCITHIPQARGWVMLVGDSHADAISDGVKAASNHLHLDMLELTGAGCEFSRKAPPTNLVPNCAEMNSALLDRATKGTDPPSLVVMSHWFKPRVAENPNWPTDLAPAINELIAAKVPILFVLDIPNFGNTDANDTSSCRGGFVNFSCVRSRTYVELNQGASRTAELSLVSNRSGITVYDPWPVFCHQQFCDSTVNGKLAYWDFDHLNGIGGLALTRGLTASIREALTKEIAGK